MASAQQLRSRIGQLESELTDLRKRLEDEECREAGLAEGIMLCEMKSSRLGGNTEPTGRKGVFVRRDYLWPKVRLVKKDGTVGDRVVIFYDWKAAS